MIKLLLISLYLAIALDLNKMLATPQGLEECVFQIKVSSQLFRLDRIKNILLQQAPATVDKNHLLKRIQQLDFL